MVFANDTTVSIRVLMHNEKMIEITIIGHYIFYQRKCPFIYLPEMITYIRVIRRRHKSV